MNSMLDYFPEQEMGQMHQDVSDFFISLFLLRTFDC